jgi:hypothetical protein
MIVERFTPEYIPYVFKESAALSSPWSSPFSIALSPLWVLEADRVFSSNTEIIKKKTFC